MTKTWTALLFLVLLGSVIYVQNGLTQVIDVKTTTAFDVKEVCDANINRLPTLQTFWNYDTQTLNVPDDRRTPPRCPPTSLELLEGVIANNDQDITQEVLNQEVLPSCLVPNLERTEALVNLNETLGLPAVNVGMPKCGSRTLGDFFKCNEMKSRHISADGLCMKEKLEKGESLQKCFGQALAIMQMDWNFPPGCIFPQVNYLDEIHRNYPNATFILNFRPVQDWKRSVHQWRGMLRRWSSKKCKIPGFVKPVTNTTTYNFWCNHVMHIREYVKQYPSHKLIELDLYDSKSTSSTLASLFRADAKCWGHSNERLTHTET